MLSGSWRRSPASSSPSSPAMAAAAGGRGGRGGCGGACGVPGGTVVLESQYDYAYHGADGRRVSIREGERFVLMRRTNSDWWQVRRIGAVSKTRPLYVPASYVVEVPIAPPPSRHTTDAAPGNAPGNAHTRRLTPGVSPSPSHLHQYPVTKTFCRSMENLNSALWGAEPGGSMGAGGHFPTVPLRGSPSSASSSGYLTVPSSSGPAHPGPSMPRSRSSNSLTQDSSPQGAGLGAGPGHWDTPSPRRTPTKSRSQWDMADVVRRHSHLQVPGQSYVSDQFSSEEEEGPIYGNVQLVSRGCHQRAGPPSPSPGQWAGPPSPSPGQRALQTLALWEQYLDVGSGRYFYVNSVTKERSWKPPRRARHQQHPPSWADTLQPRSQTQTSARSPSHLSLPLTDSTNSTGHRLSPDFLCRGQRNAERVCQVRQSMQRAVSSDALNATASRQGDAQRRGSALRQGSDMLSHSHSMILPEAHSKGREVCYSVTNIVVEPPSPDSSSDSNDSTTPELEKAGLLNKTKIAEGGRKLRKNWNLSWVVLVGNSLMFFKDPKSQTPSSWRPGSSRPESSVDLRGARLDWANEMSSKKNVFKLRTVTGNEFLLQSETDSLIREWYHTIQTVIDRLERDNPLDNVLLYCLRRAGSVDMLDHSGDEEDGRGGPKTSLPRSISSLENTEKKRVKSRLKKLILKRPPLQSLQEKGLIKDQVFGCGLEMLCAREKNPVPRFVRLCTETVERRGLETDGIYRVSGNLAVIQKLRFLVNHEGKLDLDGSEWEDIHVITGALKLFFRELPEPLVPYGYFTDMVETAKMADYLDKVERMKCLVLSLPTPNYDLMHFMFSHLKRVMEHSDSNRMTTQNIGIVFGPTLMRPERDNTNMAVNMVYQNQAVELILREFRHIFGT